MWLDTKRRQGLEGKQGSALTLAAISLVVLLAMAGLAIDLAMLYVARSEAQRAADAAAMTGAQGIGQADYPNVPQAIAETSAASKAATVGNQNLVIGLAPGLDPTKYSACAGGDTVPAGEDMCFNFSNATDPRVSVVVQRTAARGTAIPLFFMRIFGIDTADVSATATAEYYAASNRQCLKPWLLANCDPFHTDKKPNAKTNPNCPLTQGQYPEFFVYPLTPPYSCNPSTDANGCLVNPGPADAKSVSACGAVNAPANTAGVVGECLTIKPGNPSAAGAPSQYYPIQLPTGGVTPSCPSCNTSGIQGGAAAYQQNIACCNLNTTIMSCGPQMLTMKTGNMVGPTSQGVDCLIHESGGSGQDVISFVNGTAPDCAAPTGGLLFNICGGDNNPYGLSGQSGILSSDSIITVPVYDGGTLCPGIGGGGGGGASGSCVTGPITIDGYLTLFLKTETNPQGTVYAQVVSAGGCGGVPTSTPSQVAVRLIHN